MGDIADQLTEDGETMYFDHLAGHPNIPDMCPYCEDEDCEETTKPTNPS